MQVAGNWLKPQGMSKVSVLLVHKRIMRPDVIRVCC